MTVTELKQELEQAEERYQSEDSQAFQQLLEADLRSLDRLRAAERHLLGLPGAAAKGTNGMVQEVTERLQKWVASAEVRLRQLQLQEEKGCVLAVAGEFRRRVEEAREHLAQRLRLEKIDAEIAAESAYQPVPFTPAGTASAQYGPVEDLAPLPCSVEDE